MIGKNIDKDTFVKFMTEYVGQEKSSDIHCSPGNYVSSRTSGRIVKRGKEDIGILTDSSTVSIFDITMEYLSERARDHVRTELEEFSHSGYAITVNGFRFRVNVSRLRGGYYIVFRNIDSTPPEIKNLKFTEKTEDALRYVAERKEGLFLVVGPTGSGKTTTLASLINYINANFEKNIITLEDPVEYEHVPKMCHVVQRELGRDFPFFRSGLKSAMREDPDIILVGEIRDEESLELALEASETGHIVFATLHTDSAIATIQRIVSMSSNPTLTRDRLKSCLLGAIAQKLLPIVDEVEEEVEENGEKKKVKVMKNNRIILWETLVVSKSMSVLIKDGNDIQLNGLLDNTLHCQSFNKTLMDYLSVNRITKEFALKHSPDKKALAGMLSV